MNELIKSDLYRYYGKTNLKTFITCFFKFPGFRYTFYMRKTMQYHSFKPLWMFYWLLLRRCSIKYGIQIPYNTKIGKGLNISHFGTIVVNKRTVMGDNCNIHPCVNIGQSNRGKLKGTPKLGNSVWIGMGAVIVGNIQIGDNVLIAPNAYVNFDVPSNSIVMGNPAKIIERENATESFIEHKV